MKAKANSTLDIHNKSKKPKSVVSTDLGSALRTAVAHRIEHPTNYGKCSGFDSHQRYALQVASR